MISQEQKDAANNEIRAVLKWFSDEIKRINDELDRIQGANRGLDGDKAAFTGAHKEFARRMMAIGKKYNLLR